MSTSDSLDKFNNQAYDRDFLFTEDIIGFTRIKKMVEHTGSGNRVLDIGCWDGAISEMIQTRGNDVVGIDVVKESIKRAKKKGFEAHICNLEKETLPKELGKFDVAVAGEIIEHVYDTDTFVKNIRKTLKKNGLLVMTTPNLAGLGARISLLRGKTPWMIENDILTNKAGHIRYFTFETLTTLLERNKFKVLTKECDLVSLQNIKIPLLGNLFPSLGTELIVTAKKV